MSQDLQGRLLFAGVALVAFWYVKYALQAGKLPLNHRDRANNPTYFGMTVFTAAAIGVMCVIGVFLGPSHS
jgi:hypothetical protein